MDRNPVEPSPPPSRAVLLRRAWMVTAVTTIVFLITLGLALKYYPDLRGTRTASTLLAIGCCLFVVQTVLSFAARRAKRKG
jgi:hypothetical protein